MRTRLTRAVAVLAIALPLVFTGGAAADHEAMDGMSFLVLQPTFEQDLYGTHSGFLGGVAFRPSDGDVWADFCFFSGSGLVLFDRQGVAPPPAPDPGTELHPSTVTASNAGCGLTNHPDGFMYSNIDDGANGISKLDAETGAPVATMGPRGNALGISVDPQTNNIVYVGQDCRFGAGCTIWTLDPTTGIATVFAFLAAADATFIDGIAFSPDGEFLFLSIRSPAFRLGVVDRTGAVVQTAPMTSEPDGISFHATAPKFVVTNNTDGTMTRFDFPGDDYTLPPVQTPFATGGFRGDLSNVGPDGCIYLTQAGTRFDNAATSGDNSIVKICPGFAPPPGVEICGDGIDNDGDGRVDEDCPVVGVVQHYTLYELSEPELFIEAVTLVDQFGERRVRVEEAEFLMTPAEKRRTGRDPEPIVDQDVHLVCHGIAVSSFTEEIVTVRNQFTTGSTLTTGRPVWLCTPASKSLEGAAGPPPEDVDHYLCYDVRHESPSFTSETLGTSDQFGARTARLDRARELCNPVEKRRDGMEPELVLRPEAHLVCYRVVSFTPAFTARDVSTNDQFGPDTTRVVTLRRLCVPSSKDDGGGGA